MSVGDIVITVSFQISVCIDAPNVNTHPCNQVSACPPEDSRGKWCFLLGLCSQSTARAQCNLHSSILYITSCYRRSGKTLTAVFTQHSLDFPRMAGHGGTEQVERWQIGRLCQVLGRLSLQSRL